MEMNESKKREVGAESNKKWGLVLFEYLGSPLSPPPPNT